VNYVQNRKFFDSNGCGTEEGMPELEKSCLLGCAERWACGDWGKCTEAGVQTRTCNELAKCGSEKRKPLTVQPCEYDFCTDGKQNNGEQGLDCGGSCRDCTREELQEAEMKKNLLTGEAIAVQPYEAPNPFYLTPILLLLVLLIAVIALSKANLSEKMKKVLTMAHILLILSIVAMILITFKVPQATGEAVREIAGETGLSSTVLIIIAAALLLGICTHMAISNGVDIDALEQYYTKSKYWAGYAIQTFSWQHRKKKERPEIIIEPMRQQQATGVEVKQKPIIEQRPEPASARMTREETPQKTMFQSVMSGVGDIDIEISKLEEEITKMRAARPQTLPERKEPKAERMIEPAPAIKPIERLSVKKDIPAPKQIARPKEKIMPEPVKMAAPKPAKKPEKPAAAQPEKPQNKLVSRFGTEDPLKIAERILKSKTRR
jgi:hypothetical protein